MDSASNIEICVLSQDEKLASRLEELLDGFDLGVDFLSSTWDDLAAYLEVPSPGTRALCFMSLGDLCEGGLDAITQSDQFVQARPFISAVLIVEPWVQGELDSVRLVTGFDQVLLLPELSETFGDLLMGLIPGLTPPPPPPKSRSIRSATPPPAPVEESPALARSGEAQDSDVVVALSGAGQGELAEVWLSRLLYGLYVRAFTGTLKLRTGQREQTFYFKSGQAGGVHGEGAEHLLASFAWDQGHFVVTEGAVPSTFLPFASMLHLIYEGTLRHLSLNRAAERLTGFEGQYPVQTEFFTDRLEELSSLTTLARFCQHCKGSKTWSQILSVTWDDIQEALKVACYALDTDLVVMMAEPADRPAKVKYSTRSTFNVRKSLSSSSFKARGSGGGEPSDKDIAALILKLRERLNFYESTDAYELFGLHPECGAEAVRDRYYKMVKDHHPDVVGGNISPEVKALAELLFIHVKDAYVELLSLEKDATGSRASKSGPSERHTSSVRRSAPSGARKAAEAQVARLTGSRPVASANNRSTPPSEAPERDRPPRRPSGDAPIRKKTSSGLRRPNTGEQPIRPTRSAEVPPGPQRRATTETLRTSSSPMPTINKPRAPEAAPAAPTGEHRKSLQDRINENIPPDVHFKNGEKLMKTGQYDKAREAFKQAAKLERENSTYRAHYAWATYMVTPSEANRVKEILQECLKMPGRSVEANLFLARIYKRDGALKRAVKFYEAAVAEDRSCVEAQRELRLHSMRKDGGPEDDSKERAESFFGKLFQRKK